MKKIIIADDHAIVRQGLKMLLQEEKGYQVIGETDNVDGLLELLKSTDPDLIILDVSMPDMDIFETMFNLKQMEISTPVLIFTMNPEKYFAKRLLRAGAKGYINKSKEQSEILEAIKTVADGELFISPELSKLFACDMVKNQEKPLHEILTDREFQIMINIAKGKSLTEIATNFFISKTTVSNHRSSILEKLHLKNNYELIQYAISNRMV